MSTLNKYTNLLMLAMCEYIQESDKLELDYISNVRNMVRVITKRKTRWWWCQPQRLVCVLGETPNHCTVLLMEPPHVDLPDGASSFVLTPHNFQSTITLLESIASP